MTRVENSKQLYLLQQELKWATTEVSVISVICVCKIMDSLTSFDEFPFYCIFEIATFLDDLLAPFALGRSHIYSILATRFCYANLKSPISSIPFEFDSPRFPWLTHKVFRIYTTEMNDEDLHVRQYLSLRIHFIVVRLPKYWFWWL